MSKNIYYDPEKFGLEQVAEIDFSDGYYQFDYLVVWKDKDDRLYYAEDSGCSCPSPFETFTRETVTPVVEWEEIISRLHHRVAEEGEYARSGIGIEIDALKRKLREEFR